MDLISELGALAFGSRMKRLSENIMRGGEEVYRFYEKWYVAGTPISLIPIGQVDGITTKNLKYSLDNESLTMGYRSGSSNEALSDGIVSITHSSGDLLLMECWD